MKKIFFLGFLLFWAISFAQLDTEHWFAPMVDRVGNGNQIQKLYFSTNETTPFVVTIYNNNVPIGTVTISKGNPQKFSITNREQIITTFDSKLFTPNTMGLYCKGDKKYFVNLRFSIKNHGEIITSKGLSGIGTKFYATMAPITVNNGILNFMTSFMATEDNTNIQVTGFNPNVVFSDGISRTSFNVILNKGQSYIIDGTGDYSTNWNGFIGAKIESDKPISVTNGNFNGQYAGNFSTSSDILMDQSVPVNRLGNEFALVKGNGSLGNNMESGIIVATENNTDIYLNNATTPITTLQEGKYYVVPDSNYKNQGNDHYNLYIKTTKNVYVYQLLAGDSGSSTVATGGFNYIPPLNCYLPRKIDEIGLIDENEFYSNGNPGGLLNVPTKLNIITETGANITVNGVTPIATQGPFAISGTANWVTYSIPNITGNVTVASTKATTAGISAGNDAVGYGGYFAGFSSTPLITKISGICVPGILLEVNSGFDSYEWHNNQNPTQILGTANTFSPTTAGNYYVIVKSGSCPTVTSQIYTVQYCTVNSNASYSVCNNLKILPIFSTISNPILPSSVNIVTQPTKGTVSINLTTGEITYTKTPGQSGADSFVYNFCNGATFPLCETVTVNLALRVLTVQNDVLKVCKSATGTGIFNLTTASITTNSPVTIKYYPTRLDAQTDNAVAEILNFTNFTSSGQIIYAKIKTPEGCEDIAEITLDFFEYPNLNISAYNATHCDDDLDGIINIKFSTEVTPVILPNYASFTVSYYLDAAATTTPLPDNWSYPVDTTVYVRVDSPICGYIVQPIYFKIGAKVPLISSVVTQSVCDNNLNNSETILLSNYTNFFTTDTAILVVYYNTLANANAGTTTGIIPVTQTISANATFYYRFTKTGVCPNVGTLKLTFNKPTASTTLPSSLVICQGNTTTLNAGTGFSYYNWSTGLQGENANFVTVGVGNYWVELTSSNGCIYKQYVTITDSPKPVLTISAYNATHCDDDSDGIINIKFSTEVTPVILPNYASFTVSYYLDAAATTTPLPDNWSYSIDTTVYVRVDSPICGYIVQSIDFKIGAKVPLISLDKTTSVCDDDFDGLKLVDVSTFSTLFTTDTMSIVSYFDTLLDAQKNTNPIVNPVNITNSKTVYLRFQKAGVCPEVAKITINIKIPKKSTILKDKTICSGTTTSLDAGAGFDNYEWYNADTNILISSGSEIVNNLPIGNYYVNLTSNGCVYKQNVKITSIELPTINSIDIQESTVTILVSGGNPPYKYSMDSGNYQDFNIFINVSSGLHTFNVISVDNCSPVSMDVYVIGLTNVITPNGDYKNDVLDYSALKYKTNVKFSVFDRYGYLVFKGEAGNNYTWNGTANGKVLPTATYWYILEWIEPTSGKKIKYGNWVLLKNRN